MNDGNGDRTLTYGMNVHKLVVLLANADAVPPMYILVKDTKYEVVVSMDVVVSQSMCQTSSWQKRPAFYASSYARREVGHRPPAYLTPPFDHLLTLSRPSHVRTQVRLTLGRFKLGELQFPSI